MLALQVEGYLLMTIKLKSPSKPLKAQELPEVVEDQVDTAKAWLLTNEGREVCKYFTGCALGALLGGFVSYSWLALGEDAQRTIANAAMAGQIAAKEWFEMMESIRQRESEETIEEFNQKVMNS
jgi:hypothetical protein